MFITVKNPENEYNEELKSLYTTKFILSQDILASKRTIILHDNINIDKSNFAGVVVINCQIINLSVLDGKYVYDAMYNPENLLVKTVYNGFLMSKLEDLPKDLKFTEEFLKKTNFRISNAYTSVLGLWSVHKANDNFASIGVSILDMVDLRNATLYSKCPVNIYSDANASIKMEISFDGDVYQPVLPLPKPMFYSRMHSEKHREEAIITDSMQIPFQDICDEFTKIVRIKKKDEKLLETDFCKKSCLEYLNTDGSTLVQTSGEPPVRSILSMLRSLSDDLYSKLFKFFCRYQLSSINFICDVGRQKFSISSMTFSYNNPPEDFATTVIHEIVCDEKLYECIEKLKIMYGNIRIFGRITDLRYDITVLFIDGHKSIKQLKYVKYSTLVSDIWSSMLDIETSISSPIVSFFHSNQHYEPMM